MAGSANENQYTQPTNECFRAWSAFSLMPDRMPHDNRIILSHLNRINFDLDKLSMRFA